MSHQFKPGDLVIIVGANSLTQNIGKHCELRQFVISGDRFLAPNGVMYNHCDVPCWTLAGEGLVAVIDGEVADFGFGVHEERHLMPLRGDFAPTEENSQAEQV